jgi:predicted ATP-dependent endonuclease of OLD family
VAETGVERGEGHLSVRSTGNSTAWGQTILIDKPTSFLHPGATRKLLEVMQDRRDHQYIVSTHSPVLIQAVQPNSVWLTRYEADQSTIHEVDLEKTEDLRLFLREIGVRLGDVFGADNVIWVEGETEEDCFPIIVRRVLGMRMHGSVFRAAD